MSNRRRRPTRKEKQQANDVVMLFGMGIAAVVLFVLVLLKLAGVV